MTAFSADSIESTTIVGFQQNPVSGYKMMTPTLEMIGVDELPIDKFEVKGATDGQASIQVMNAAGKWTGTYYWYNELVDGDVSYPAGWFDFAGETPANITLKKGDAVFFYTEEDGVTVGNAGVVSANEIVNDISGYKMVGNCTPVALAIDSLEVRGATDGLTSIQVMNAAGKWTGTYYWYNELVDGDVTYPAGWFDFAGETPADITLQPGDAVFFYTEETGVQAVIPAAL